MRPDRLLARLSGGELENVGFADLERLLRALGFELRRVLGSHRIYAHAAIPGNFSVQPRGGQAKPYQLRQLLRWVEAYNLVPGNER